MNDKFRKQMIKTKLLTGFVNKAQNSSIQLSCRKCSWGESKEEKDANAILIAS
jgi:hypothetical protein